VGTVRALSGTKTARIHETDLSPVSIPKAKNEWSYTFTPPYACMLCTRVALPVTLPYTHAVTQTVSCWDQ
jgi:hypothetical protein